MTADSLPNPPTRILVAEDSPTQAENLRHLLEHQGYEVHVAANGREALDLALRLHPAVIVSDVVMPEVDGYELCRRIKRNEQLVDTPVILVTTMTDPEDVIRGLEAGADNFIAKPYDERYLLGRVRYALANRELRHSRETGMGLEVYFNNQKHFITADRLQILNLLLSTYEAAIQRNRELTQAQRDLRGANSALGAVNQRLEREMQERREVQNQRDRFFKLPLDMLCIAGPDGYFKSVNPAFSETLGYTAQELMERPFWDFLHPDDRDRTLALFKRIQQDPALAEIENRYRCRDGSWKWLSWRIQPFPEGRFYAAARDVTQARRMMEELEEARHDAEYANQAKSQFLATMSHEIRTPLIGVLGMLELLGRTALSGEQRRQFNIIQQSANSLLDIVGDILDYSKIEAGKLELAPETVSVRELVSRVVSNFSANAQGKGLQLVQRIEPQVAAAHVADSARLLQILRNFVSNAVKFTPAGTVEVRVTVIETRDEAQRLRFCVADTGIGMTAEQLGRLFQPFAQADLSTTRRFGGSGLGLVICRRLAELMQGCVRAESTEGRGTVMTLELTLAIGRVSELARLAAARQPEVPARAAPPRDQAEREGSLLLLAEDHPINREVLTGQLNMAGFHVDAAEDGARALEMFKAARYALVLTDLHMPGLDGLQLAAAIRGLEQAGARPRTPVVVLTANVLRDDVERCLAGGIDDYLSKPATMRQLVDKLARWLPHLAWLKGGDEPPAATTLLQPAALEHYTGGDRAKLHELLQHYCRTAVADLAALRAAIGRGDGSVANAAHRIKGAAQMVGAQEVADIAGLLERADDHELEALATQLQGAMTRLEDHVRSLAP